MSENGFAERPTSKSPALIAEKLRQSAGVNLVNEDGSAIGWGELVKQEAERLDKIWGDKEPDENNPEYHFWQNIKLWLDGSEASALTVEGTLGKERVTLSELASMRKMIEKAVDAEFAERFPQDDNNTNWLTASTPTRELELMGQEARVKIEYIQQHWSELDDLANEGKKEKLEQLTQALTQADAFLKEDLAIKDPEEGSAPSQEWQEKWQRIMVRGEERHKDPKNTAEDDKDKQTKKRRLRALRLYKAFVDGNPAQIAAQIENDTLQLASARNLYKLVEMMSESETDEDRSELYKTLKDALRGYKKVNFPAVKKEVEEIINKDNIGKEDLVELLKTLGDITKFIRINFQHDHAYLLGQALEHRQAVCAGKEMMLGMILDRLGLKPIYASVDISFNNSIGEHVVTQLEFGDYLVEIDLNAPPFNKNQEDISGCLVNILQKEAVVEDRPSDQELKEVNNTQYRRHKGEYTQYKLIWGESPHKATSSGGFSVDYVRRNNLANLLRDEFWLAHLDSDEKRLQSLQEAERLHRESMELNPDDPDYKNNFANLLQDKFWLESLDSDEKRLQSLQEAERLYRESMELNPDDLGNKINYFVLFYYHSETLLGECESQQQKQDMLKRAIACGYFCLAQNYWPDSYEDDSLLISGWRKLLQ